MRQTLVHWIYILSKKFQDFPGIFYFPCLLQIISNGNLDLAASRKSGSAPACSPDIIWFILPKRWLPLSTWRQPFFFIDLIESFIILLLQMYQIYAQKGICIWASRHHIYSSLCLYWVLSAAEFNSIIKITSCNLSFLCR